MTANKIPKQVLFMLISVMLLTSCARNWTFSFTKERNVNKFRDEGMIEEVVFIMNLKSASILIRNLAYYARDSAYSAKVQKYSSKLHSDFILLDPEINVLAAKEGIKLSNQMSSEHWTMYRDVKGQKNLEFDEKFLSTMIKVHNKLLEKANVLASEAVNNSIRSFSARKISFLEENLEKSVKLNSEVLTLN